MSGVDFEILKLWRGFPGLSFIEFDEKYFKFSYPNQINKNYAIFEDMENLILKSRTNFESWLLKDYQIILNKEIKINYER